jgi:hypothetical protein
MDFSFFLANQLAQIYRQTASGLKTWGRNKLFIFGLYFIYKMRPECRGVKPARESFRLVREEERTAATPLGQISSYGFAIN